MLSIQIVRHGQTDYNKKRIVQGSGVDSTLNSVGLKQAQMFYNGYKNAGFEKIYVSPLTRTLQTILLFEKIVEKVEYSDALKEISWGVHEGKRPTLKMKRQFDQMLQRWEAGETHLCVKEGGKP